MFRISRGSQLTSAINLYQNAHPLLEILLISLFKRDFFAGLCRTCGWQLAPRGGISGTRAYHAVFDRYSVYPRLARLALLTYQYLYTLSGLSSLSSSLPLSQTLAQVVAKMRTVTENINICDIRRSPLVVIAHGHVLDSI